MKQLNLIKAEDEELINIKEEEMFGVTKITGIFSIRKNGDFKNKGFSLSSAYEWVIGKDSNGYICLIPKKGGGVNE